MKKTYAKDNFQDKIDEDKDDLKDNDKLKDEDDLDDEVVLKNKTEWSISRALIWSIFIVQSTEGQHNKNWNNFNFI